MITDIQAAEIEDIANEVDDVFKRIQKLRIGAAVTHDQEVFIPTRVIAEMLYLRGLKKVSN